MKTTLKIYVSSTYEDLKEYRAAVIASLRKMGMQPVCMEDYTAGGNKPVDKCLADVAACDAYVGIIAWRYGFIPPGHDHSITELEYREAKKKRIPAHLFLLHDQAEWPDDMRDTGTNGERNMSFREELKLVESVALFQPSPHALANEVQAAIYRDVHARHSRFRTVAISALLVLALVFGGYFWLTSIKQEMASLQGEVMSPDDKPIVGAVVELDKLPGKPVRTMTGGDFSFDEVPGKVGDPVTITVKAPGYMIDIRKGLLNKPEQIVLKREMAK